MNGTLMFRHYNLTHNGESTSSIHKYPLMGFSPLTAGSTQTMDPSDTQSPEVLLRIAAVVCLRVCDSSRDGSDVVA